MNLALDTNRYCDICRGDTVVINIVESAAMFFLPFLVVAELRAGFRLSTQGKNNEQLLHRFLMKHGVAVLYPDHQTSHHYAGLYRQLRQQGTPIPTNDLWIAALVLQHSLALCDRDRHFDALPQLVRV